MEMQAAHPPKYSGALSIRTALWHRAIRRMETVIRDYIRNQGQEDKRLDQMNLWRKPAAVPVALELRGRVSDPA